MSNIIQSQNIERLQKGEKLPWGEIANALEYAFENNLWEGPSFSSWVKEIAKKLSVQPSLLWRYRSARAFYVEQANKKPSLLPSFIEVAPRMNAENLDILRRIASAAPEEVTFDLLEKLIEGKMSRSKLTKSWHLYRDTLDGDTLRGHISSRTSKSKKSRSSEEDQRKALMLDKLFSATPNWIGIENLEKYRFFPRTMIPIGNNLAFEIDAFLVTTHKNQVLFHGIEFEHGNMVLESIIRKSKNNINTEDFFDTFWFYIEEPPNQSDIYGSGNIGILTIKDDAIHVIKPAQRKSQDEDSRLSLAKSTIRRLL